MASDFNWRTRVTDSLKAWFSRLQRGVDTSIYYMLCASALWPIVEAYNSGDPARITAAFSELVKSVGVNLLSNRLGDLAKQKTVEDTARQLKKAVADEPALRDELNTLLEKLDVLTQARQVLSESERQWFVDTLREELQQSGNFSSFAQNVIFTGSIHADVTVNVFQSAVDQRAEYALNRYRRVLKERYERLSLLGIDPAAGKPTNEFSRPELAQVYIDIDTTTTIHVSEEKRRHHRETALPDDRKQEPLSALEAVRTNHRVVLLGDPGSGKSTFVNHLVLCLAGQGVAPREGWLPRLRRWSWDEAALVPIVVILRDFVRQLPPNTMKAEVGQLWEFLTSQFANDGLSAAVPLVEEKLEHGQVMLLFDGLDEIAEPRQRALVRDLVTAWATQYPTCRLLVTCRILSYQDPAWRLTDFQTFTLAPFTESQSNAFIDAWYREFVRLRVLTEERADYLARRLCQVIWAPERKELRELASNPLLLTIMAQTHSHAELPNTRAQLYNQVVNMLLYQWDQQKMDTTEEAPRLGQLFSQVSRSVEQLRPILEELAYKAHSDGGRTGPASLVGISQSQIKDALAPFHPEQSLVWVQKVIDAMQQRTGLLLARDPEVYTFPHLTFQEYLAGVYLSRIRDPKDREAKDLFVPTAVGLANEWTQWRNAILLAAGHIVHVDNDAPKLLLLARELCPTQVRENSDSAWRKVWLAGEVLLEIGLKNRQVEEFDLHAELLDRVRQRLVELLQGGYLSPVERARAGDTLVELGDPRFSDDDLCLPDDKEFPLGFIEIPAGPFLMGSDPEKDEYAEEGEQPQHTVELPTYYMARYPVTVAQFRAFVEQSGYQPADEDSLQGVDNHPVVYVTWYDAIAYCEWLTGKLQGRSDLPEPLATIVREGGQVTLPSEAEWEKAARGTDGRLYPWRNEFDPNKANIRETGIEKTSVVGCFPQGESPYHVLDLAGNVWEWTRSLWGEDVEEPTFRYPYDPNDGRENLSAPNNVRRVLRGGAFGAFSGARVAPSATGAARTSAAPTGDFGWWCSQKSLDSEASGLWNSGNGART